MIEFTRAAGSPGTPDLRTLTLRQRMVVEIIEQYERATDEACPATVIARRLRVHHSTIQDHLSALHRKGWLRTPHAPARLRARDE